MNDTTKMISAVYDICKNPNSSYSFDEIPSKDKLSSILTALQYNLTKDTISIPVNSNKYSFVTTVNHMRNQNSNFGLDTIISDGYKIHNQYLVNKNKQQSKHSFRFNSKFSGQNIPTNKIIKTKHGPYNIDELVSHITAEGWPSDPHARGYRNESMWDGGIEEHAIIGHPFLDPEIRAKYIARCQQISDNNSQLVDLLQCNLNILNLIGQFGILFLNVNLPNPTYKALLQSFINKLGDGTNNSLLGHNIFQKSPFTVKELLANASNDKPSPLELGYYLTLLYIKSFDKCKQADDSLQILPYFKDVTTSCNKSVYVGTYTVPPITIVEDIDQYNPNDPSKHFAFLAIPSTYECQLIPTQLEASNNLREDMETDSSQQNKSVEPNSSQNYHSSDSFETINMNEFCSQLEDVLLKDLLFFSNPLLTHNIRKLYEELMQNYGLNQ